MTRYDLCDALPPGWRSVLAEEIRQPYFAALADHLNRERAEHHIYPAREQVFAAFAACPPGDVKVVLLGQDPYHGPGQAHGLSFSVPPEIPQPPSLRNISKEIERDLGITPLPSGDLSRWSRQGVFLLNSFLTVREGEAGSHHRLGWDRFTDAVIAYLGQERQGLVFLLWGNFAKAKARLIHPHHHLILTSGHPSPLSVRFFRGNGHFSAANVYLRERGRRPIDWR